MAVRLTSQMRVCSLCTAASMGTACPWLSSSCFRRAPGAGRSRLACTGTER